MLCFNFFSNIFGGFSCFCLISFFLFITGSLFFRFHLFLSWCFFNLILLLLLLHDVLLCFLVRHKSLNFCGGFFRHRGVMMGHFDSFVCLISFVFYCLQSLFNVLLLFFFSFSHVLSYGSFISNLLLLIEILLVIDLLLSLILSLLNVLLLSKGFFTFDVKLVLFVQFLSPCISRFSKIFQFCLQLHDGVFSLLKLLLSLIKIILSISVTSVENLEQVLLFMHFVFSSTVHI